MQPMLGVTLWHGFFIFYALADFCPFHWGRSGGWGARGATPDKGSVSSSEPFCSGTVIINSVLITNGAGGGTHGEK